MGITYETIVTESVGKQIAQNIREAIVSGKLKIDEKLPTEEDLAQRFEVSRPTIREALKTLAAQNLIRSRRGPAGGNFVQKPSMGDLTTTLSNACSLLVSVGEIDLSDISEARLELETMCVRMAAKRRSKEHLEQMATEIAIQQDSAIDDVAFCASDVRFHQTLAQTTGNPLLQLAMLPVIAALQPASNMVVFRHRKREIIVDQHVRMHQALAARDGVAAEQVVVEQVEYLRTQYMLAQSSIKQG